MKATHRVTNGNHNTVGFIIENKYIKYYDALRNIDLIDNLDVSEDNVIQPKSFKLEEISVQEINKEIYDEKIKSNPLLRDVQSELERWKTKWSNMVLYLTGARQIGKTTELLKFAYKNYDQIIYINLSQEASLKAFEELVISNTPSTTNNK